MLPVTVAFVVVFLLVAGRWMWCTVAAAAEDRGRAWRVEAVIAIEDELLVLLEGGSPEASRWLHSHASVQAVVMLVRWRSARTAITIVDDGSDTVLRPRPSQIGLRFRQQATLAAVDVVRNADY